MLKISVSRLLYFLALFRQTDCLLGGCAVVIIIIIRAVIVLMTEELRLYVTEYEMNYYTTILII